MDDLNKYEKDLKTCSKCGLCQSVCPIYKTTGNESLLSRGKFNIILGLIQKKLNFTQNIKENLDICFYCGACEDFCPSSIKATEIFTSVKYHYTNAQNGLSTELKSILIGSFVQFYRNFSILFLPIKILPFSRKYFKILDFLAKINVIYKKNTSKKSSKIKVIYFEGCYTKYINPSVKNATLTILDKLNIEVIRKNFDCCNISKFYNGNIKEFEKAKAKNLEIFNNNSYDYIITDCASCASAIKKYNNLISDKVLDITQLIDILNINLNIKNNEKITYHLPCHFRNDKEKMHNFICKTFQKNYIQMENFDECCGFTNNFSPKMQEISQLVLKTKIENIKRTNTKYLLTSCPACEINIKSGLVQHNSNDIEVINLAEYIAINI